ncbi:MAG TPA: rhodanese-like domain-containing protein [Bacteroidales bacterium]|nr:rhodanese-like domain-containing protein [Bacteroidales bacterium]
MKTNRIPFSITLIVLSLILAFLPLSGRYSLHGKPENVMKAAMDQSSYITPDEVARAVVSEDNSVRLIDLRSRDEYKRSNIPGSVNIPYSEFLSSDLESLLGSDMKKIFYCDNDLESNYAWLLATGIGFSNCYVMKGGLSGWNKDIMKSVFKGETISARENALFEVRFKARTMFDEINSLPDSLKEKYMASKEIERKKLDGGCE